MKFKIDQLHIIGFTTISLLLVLLLIAGVSFYYQDTDQASYNGRIYNKSTVQEIEGNLKMLLDTTKPTGKYYKGMEIYDLENNPFHSTVIFLRTKDGEFWTYSLSGGP